MRLRFTTLELILVLPNKNFMVSRKKPRIDVSQKISSFSLFLAIPTSFVVGFILLFTMLDLVLNFSWYQQRSLYFLGCFILSGAVWATVSLRTFRTFIHELKHAVAIVLSGNLITDFHVERDTGHVTYQLYRGKTQFGPFIMLAPYFYPLTSFPVFCVALVLDQYQGTLLACILGATLAFDIFTGIGEIHSHQSDIKRLRGGIFVGGSYIAGVIFMWTAFCILWTMGGRVSFELAMLNFYKLGIRVVDKWMATL